MLRALVRKWKAWWNKEAAATNTSTAEQLRQHREEYDEVVRWHRAFMKRIEK
jgi:hypothetical protein